MNSDILMTGLISLVIHAAIVGFVEMPESRLEMPALPQGGQTLQLNVTLSSPQVSQPETTAEIDQPEPAPVQPEARPLKDIITTRGESLQKAVAQTETTVSTPVKKPNHQKPEPQAIPDNKPPAKNVARRESPQPVQSPLKGNSQQEVTRSDNVSGLTDKRPLVSEPLFNGAQRKPAYPYQARRRGQQGTVMLEVFLDNRGQVESVTLVDSSGFSLLDRAAEKAVRGWSFRPLVRSGVAIASRVRVPVIFSLDA